MSDQELSHGECKALQWTSVAVVTFGLTKSQGKLFFLMSMWGTNHSSTPHDYKEALKISQDCVQPEKTKEQNIPIYAGYEKQAKNGKWISRLMVIMYILK